MNDTNKDVNEMKASVKGERCGDGAHDSLMSSERESLLRNEFHVVATKKLRVEIDAVIKNLHKESLQRYSHERKIAVMKLQEAVMWLGMDLEDLNAPNPYPNSYNPANTIVDPTADNLKL